MGAGHEIWKLIFELVRNLSEVLLQTIPGFWKVAKGYMEGKYQKVSVRECLYLSIEPNIPRNHCRKTIRPRLRPTGAGGVQHNVAS